MSADKIDLTRYLDKLFPLCSHPCNLCTRTIAHYLNCCAETIRDWYIVRRRKCGIGAALAPRCECHALLESEELQSVAVVYEAINTIALAAE